jgi:hypothetical protein
MVSSALVMRQKAKPDRRNAAIGPSLMSC